MTLLICFDFWLGLTKREFPTKSLALMGTASFFVIAIADKFNLLIRVVRNDKKDIVDSRFPASN
ncbi:hypothetical protein OMO38_16885, partial [Chryseobacterium sp. 09-1422]